MTILEKFRVDGRTAIVTGAGRGIGRSCALALAEAGADVLVVARSADQLESVAEEVRAIGRRCEPLSFDMMNLDSLGDLVAHATTHLGGVDLIVNNAGGSMPKPFLDTSTRSFERAFSFNVTTAFELTRQAVPAMLERGGGAVVNISSAAGRIPDRGFSAYGTAKAALSYMTKELAADLSPRIRVNAVAAGSIATSALDMVLGDENLRTTMEASIPMHRIGTPEDIAAAVLYLCSDASAYVTGKVIEVDGGINSQVLGLGLPDL